MTQTDKHQQLLDNLTPEEFMGMIEDDSLDFDYLKTIARDRYLQGQKKYGKVRKLDFSSEAYEELADYVNYKLFSWLDENTDDESAD